jgi:hypothetical protein
MARPAPSRPKLIFQDNALLNGAQQGTLLDHIKAAGGRAIQQDVIYGGVHTGAGYNLAAYDQLVNAARKRGLGVRFRLMGTPEYMAKSRPGVDVSLSASRPDPALMRVFARDMSQHFAGRVGGYSIWNEPNVQSFINEPNPKLAAKMYRRLYQSGYLGVKEGNRKARVGFGEITSQSPNEVGGSSTVGFLKNVIAAGPKPLHADYAAIHPYQWSNPNVRPNNPLYGGISNLPAIQKVLADLAHRGRFTQASGGKVPLSLSEFGYKHDAQPNAATRAAWLRRSMQLAQQAGVQDVNMYQLVPSRPGDYWDSSIANSRGKIDPRVLRALRGTRKKGT